MYPVCNVCIIMMLFAVQTSMACAWLLAAALMPELRYTAPYRTVLLQQLHVAPVAACVAHLLSGSAGNVTFFHPVAVPL
jgi:hypothetical protein